MVKFRLLKISTPRVAEIKRVPEEYCKIKYIAVHPDDVINIKARNFSPSYIDDLGEVEFPYVNEKIVYEFQRKIK